MSTFQYPKTVMSGGPSRAWEYEVITRAISNAETHGWPLTTAEIHKATVAYSSEEISGQRVSQLMYQRGYRALEGTIKPYGRGHTWVWYKPAPLDDEDIVYRQEPDLVDRVFGTATGQYTGYEEWRDLAFPYFNESRVIDIINAYEIAGLEVRIQTRSKK